MLKDNQELKRYELLHEDSIAYVEYIKAQDKIYLTHTEVPRKLEGQGIGSKIVGLVLEDVKKQDLTLIPLCPFVAGYIKKNPDYTSLVLKGINIT